MIERAPQPDDGLTANDLLESMMADSIGLDNPMTPEALLVAGAEVSLRIETARKILRGEISEIEDIDTEGMAALYLMQFGGEI